MILRWLRRHVGLTIFLGSALAVLGYAFALEPYWIEVTRHTVALAVRTPLKIAHVTDLHSRGFGRRERRLLALLDQEQPDLIVVTGDCPVGGGRTEAPAETLSKLHAPLGVIVVRGNWEIWKPLRDERAFYQAVGATLLVNQAYRLREDLWIVGFDDEMAGHPTLETLQHVPPGPATLALFHSPAFFDRLAGRVSLALAGHTHGGQISLPWIGPVWLPRGSGGYVNGWYKRGGSRLLVSRGIGTSIIHARFLCRPELAMVTLQAN